ncbi:uncharacterized protein LOC111097597 isoform X1 [Canis lupus familiaris]|uniref:uncharacterized protein LOC111097597 isoform X1 n=1 Tax=Canis lupus familiaris TaxID=9615 RepID=UPI0018F6961B|nr:uncharacterized protein LOC111097597 isoform X1 [Canis lupus familiaris]XP_035577631.2 uncharacterized protein LOC112677858 isoform X1 [Canis lupus dingo]XP_038535267.1 uncharacterized protein LOC111097597 isoform X1 [Canis lupus familiaris]
MFLTFRILLMGNRGPAEDKAQGISHKTPPPRVGSVWHSPAGSQGLAAGKTTFNLMMASVSPRSSSTCENPLKPPFPSLPQVCRCVLSHPPRPPLFLPTGPAPVLSEKPPSCTKDVSRIPSWSSAPDSPHQTSPIVQNFITLRTQDPCEDSLGMGLEQASGLRAEAAAGASVPRTLSQKCTDIHTPRSTLQCASGCSKPLTSLGGLKKKKSDLCERNFEQNFRLLSLLQGGMLKVQTYKDLRTLPSKITF